MQKISLLLWRVRWCNLLPAKDRLIKRGMAISGECALCGKIPKSIDYVFFECESERWMLKEGFMTVGNITNIHNIKDFTTTTTEIANTTVDSKNCGLHWTLFGIILFELWKERNQKYKTDKLCSKEVKIKICITTTEIRYREASFKKMHTCNREHSVIYQWEVLNDQGRIH